MKNAEKLFEGIGYVDEHWLSLLNESDAVRTCSQKQKNRQFVGYEIKKLLGVKYGYSSFSF